MTSRTPRSGTGTSSSRSSAARTTKSRTASSGRGDASKSKARSSTTATGRAAQARRRSTRSDRRSDDRREGDRRRVDRGRAAGDRRTGDRRVGDRRVQARRSSERREAFWRGAGSLVNPKTSPLPVTHGGQRAGAWMTVLVAGLTMFGLVMVLSASSVASTYEADSPFVRFEEQLMWAGIGAVVFLIARSVDYRWLQRISIPAAVLSGLLLVLTLIPGIGIRINGSRRWMGVGPVVIQPAELAKVALIIFIADLLTRRARYMERPELTVRPVLVVLGSYCGLILLQPKLGTTIVLGAVAFTMLFIGGARIRNLVSWSLVLGLAGGYFAYSAPYRRRRIFAYLDPFADPLGDGLQTIQSQVGIASGGLLGVGLGAGRTKWGFLPYADSDFIFALVAEEVGLIGGTAVILAFLLLGYFGVRVALKAPDRFGMLLAVGITTWLLLQAFMNIGMAMGLMPITGEPLPFVSAGGSGLVTALGASGLLVNVARRARL